MDIAVLKITHTILRDDGTSREAAPLRAVAGVTYPGTKLVLEPLHPHTQFPAAPIANSDQVEVGDAVVLLAYDGDSAAQPTAVPLEVTKVRQSSAATFMFLSPEVIDTRNVARSGGPVFWRQQLVGFALSSNVPWKEARWGRARCPFVACPCRCASHMRLPTPAHTRALPPSPSPDLRGPISAAYAVTPLRRHAATRPSSLPGHPRGSTAAAPRGTASSPACRHAAPPTLCPRSCSRL
jgi:hypothetical protein